MQQLIIIIHVLTACALVVLVLLQYGKGAAVGAAFGSGASNTMFGSVGSAPFLVKVTVLLAAIFFSTSLILAYQAMHASHSPRAQSIVDSIPVTAPTTSVAPSTSTLSTKGGAVEQTKKK